MIINGGTGNGYSVGVTENNKLLVSSVSNKLIHHINHIEGEVYSAGVIATPTAGAAVSTCIMYIKNDSEKDMIIQSGALSVETTNVYLSIILGMTGTPTNTTDLSLSNRNAGSGNVADVTSYIGADGAGIGGLTNGNTVGSFRTIAGLESKLYTIDSGFIVPKNQTFTLWASGDCSNLSVGLGVSFHEKVE